MTANEEPSTQAADILVVDDTIASLRMLTDILSRAGYKPRPVEDPQLALEAALAQPPSLILLDVRMPRMSGFELCRRLKQDERTRDVPVIFVTALEDIEDRVQGFEVGGVDFLSKPVQEAEVLARVKTHLQLRYTQLHLEELVAERTAEITKSEARYRSLVDNSVVGVAISAADGRLLFVNDALARMYDFDAPEQMIARGALERWHDPEVRDRFLAELEQHGSVTDFEGETITHTGRHIHVAISTKLLGDTLYSMVMDITERRQAQQALRDSEHKFRQMFRTGPVSFTITRLRDGLYIDVNDVWLKRKGYRREDVIGKTVAELGIWPDSEDRAELVDRLTRDGSVRNMEVDSRLADGSIHRVLQSCSLITVKGKPHIVTAGMDIQALVDALEEQRKSEERFRVTFEQAAVGIGHVALEGRFLRLNQKFCDIVGYSHDEMLELSFQDITHPDDLDTDLVYVRQLLAGEADTYSLEKRYFRKDGEIVWVNLTVSLLREPDGEPGWFVAVVEDITVRVQAEQELMRYKDHLESLVEERTLHLETEIEERKQTEEALAASEEKYRDLVESVSDVIYALDSQGVVTYISPAIEQVLGLSPDEIIGQSFIAFILPEDLERAKKNIGELVRGEQPGLSEYQVVHPSGEVRWIRVSSSPITSEERVTGFQGVLSDITEIKHSEITLRESEQRFKALFQSMPLPSYYWQRRGEDIVMVDYNAAADEFTRGGASKLRGLSLTEIYPDRPDIVEDISRCLAEEVNMRKEMEYRPRTVEEDMILEVTYSFAPPDLVIVQTEEISARKLLEAQIERSAAMEERARLARDLHDAVTQTLFSASLLADTLPRIWERDRAMARQNLNQLGRLVRGALAEMRTLLFELRTDALQDQTLDQLLHPLVEAAGARARAESNLSIQGDCDLPEKVTMALHRIAQESLNNVAKHAEATTVNVDLNCSPESVVLRLSDDGRGFDPAQIPPGHMGIGIMKERAQEIGAIFEIESQRGHGTHVVVTWSDQGEGNVDD